MKYFLLFVSYAISSVWVYLCCTVSMDDLPKGLFWMIVLFGLLAIQAALAGEVSRRFGKRDANLAAVVIRLPVLLFIAGFVLFLMINYASAGGRYGERIIYY